MLHPTPTCMRTCVRWRIFENFKPHWNWCEIFSLLCYCRNFLEEVSLLSTTSWTKNRLYRVAQSSFTRDNYKFSFKVKGHRTTRYFIFSKGKIITDISKEIAQLFTFPYINIYNIFHQVEKCRHFRTLLSFYWNTYGNFRFCLTFK